jgi:hypothetical protein
MTGFTLQERQDIQALLEANKDQLENNYREQVRMKQNSCGGLEGVLDIPGAALAALNCEAMLEFNASAIRQMQKAVSQPSQKKSTASRFGTSDPRPE